MGQSNPPDQSRSAHFTGLLATSHCSHARAEPRWQGVAKQRAGGKATYLAISQTVAGTGVPAPAFATDTRSSAARSQCSLTLIPSANLIQSPKYWLDCDHHGNIGTERAFDQVGEALAVALPLSEAVDDEEVGAGAKRLGDPRSRILKPRKIKPAAACAGSKSCGSNIFSPLWTSTADRLESAH